MTAKSLVSGLMEVVVDDNIATYIALFSHTPISKTSDAYWKRALGFFADLTENERSVFFEILRQVIVDTTSNVLGVLDGVTSVPGLEAQCALLSDAGEKLNGDLQSLFLAEYEKRGK